MSTSFDNSKVANSGRFFRSAQTVRTQYIGETQKQKSTSGCTPRVPMMQTANLGDHIAFGGMLDFTRRWRVAAG